MFFRPGAVAKYQGATNTGVGFYANALLLKITTITSGTSS